MNHRKFRDIANDIVLNAEFDQLEELGKAIEGALAHRKHDAVKRTKLEKNGTGYKITTSDGSIYVLKPTKKIGPTSSYDIYTTDTKYSSGTVIRKDWRFGVNQARLDLELKKLQMPSKSK